MLMKGIIKRIFQGPRPLNRPPLPRIPSSGGLVAADDPGRLVILVTEGDHDWRRDAKGRLPSER